MPMSSQCTEPLSAYLRRNVLVLRLAVLGEALGQIVLRAHAPESLVLPSQGGSETPPSCTLATATRAASGLDPSAACAHRQPASSKGGGARVQRRAPRRNARLGLSL
eukprot:892710-Rhodomonas_salina.1